MLAFLLLALAADDALAAKLNEVMDGPDYRGARWGVLIVTADGGKVVYERNADQLFAPASVTKLYSCAAAFLALGPDKRFTTAVYRRGDDLILVPSGDLTLGGRTKKDGTLAFTDDDHTYAGPTSGATLTATDPLAGLDWLAERVGRRRVRGDVLVDDRLFEPGVGSGSGPKTLSPIVVNDNVVDVTVTPAAKAGERAAFELRPATGVIGADVDVETVEKGKPTSIRVDRVDGRSFAVRGTIAVGAKPVVRVYPVGEPAWFARGLFIEALRRKGVPVDASPLRAAKAPLPEPEWYAKQEPLCRYESAPLAETLKVTLKVSHNLYASTLPLLLRQDGKKPPRTVPDGLRMQGDILRKLGVDVDRISLESGAGGGDGDRVSPRVTVGLLQKLYERKDWKAFEDLLPVLGVDGTLTTAVDATSAAVGKVKGKTGTYTDNNNLLGRPHLRAKSLAGIATTAKGTKLLMCVFVNDVLLPRGVTGRREGRAIGRLCEILHEHGP